MGKGGTTDVDMLGCEWSKLAGTGGTPGEEEEGKAMLERWREVRFVQFAEWNWRARKAVGTICK